MATDNTANLHIRWLEVVNLLSELVVFKQYDFNEFLQKLITVVLEVVPVDSCLIYFYDWEKKELILIGSKKSHDELIGHIALKKGEGITGWVAEHNTPVAIQSEAYKDSRFKFFSELPEDKSEAFLSVPIMDENGTVGVINLQSKLPYSFSKEQIRTVGAIVKIISSAFEKVVLERRVGRLENKLKERQIIEEAKGIIMKVKDLDEAKAYDYLRRESMTKRKSMREIAEAVLLVLK
jgi:signal transduction protein with GAF and PtsI domain